MNFLETDTHDIIGYNVWNKGKGDCSMIMVKQNKTKQTNRQTKKRLLFKK